MKAFFKTPLAILAAVLALSACAGPGEVSRNAPLDFTPVIEVPTQDWAFAGLIVSVPGTLSVSEANRIKPRADIVWREDPLGDRRQQVRDMVAEALMPALSPMAGSTPVIIRVEMERFHAVTERARYTIGGEHEIEFTLTVTHAETGAILSGPRSVDLTFRAYGGQQALEAESVGITQRVRISEAFANWARAEFPTLPPVLRSTSVY
jgi:hypothetical protein